MLVGIYATQLQDTGAKWYGLYIMWDMFIHLAFTLSLFGASQVSNKTVTCSLMTDDDSII